MAKKTGSNSVPTSIGVVYCGRKKDQVLPEPKVDGAILIRGKGFQITVRNPKRVDDILAKYPGSCIVSS